MEIEIVTFAVKGSMKLTVPTDWQEQIQVLIIKILNLMILYITRFNI